MTYVVVNDNAASVNLMYMYLFKGTPNGHIAIHMCINPLAMETTNDNPVTTIWNIV